MNIPTGSTALAIENNALREQLTEARAAFQSEQALSISAIEQMRKEMELYRARWLSCVTPEEAARLRDENARLEAELAKARPQKHGVYIASKVKHADRWIFLRDTVGEPIISTWIDEAGEGESADKADLWRRCIQEASSAQALILYREPGEILKGGWIELGAALASGTRVFAIGIEEFTVASDHRIQHFADMKSAIAAAHALRPASPPSSENA